jgi:hypothetical protein
MGDALRCIAYMLVCCLCLIGTLASGASPAVANATAAAKSLSDLIIKTGAVEASVFVDAGIKADPALTFDCLTEGKRWIDKNAAEAEDSRKQNPLQFHWSFERKYVTRSLVYLHYVSIVASDYMDTGGAHPNSDVHAILWDSHTKTRISIRPFFNETLDNGPTMKAIVSAVIASLNVEKKKRGASETTTAEWYKGLERRLLKIGAVTLAPSTEATKSSGLKFYYPPYAVGPYAEGEYIVFVPWETLRPYLSQEGTNIFAGARPKNDDDGSR